MSARDDANGRRPPAGQHQCIDLSKQLGIVYGWSAAQAQASEDSRAMACAGVATVCLQFEAARGEFVQFVIAELVQARQQALRQ